MLESQPVPLSELDPADPYARATQTYPRLSEEMAARVAQYGREERLASGTFVFERGQRAVDFFLVLDGSIEILDTDVCDNERVITVHGAGQFTGELDLFNDRKVLVSGRAAGDTRVARSSAWTSGAWSRMNRTSASSSCEPSS